MKHIHKKFYIIIFILFSCCVHQPKPDNNNASISIQHIDVQPTNARRGKDVTVTITYSVSNVPSAGINVLEKTTILKNNEIINTLQEKEYLRKNGTWESYVTFGVPKRIARGKYHIELQLMTQNIIRTKVVGFTVK